MIKLPIGLLFDENNVDIKCWPEGLLIMSRIRYVADRIMKRHD